MFQSALLKLTGFYLFILMAVSIFFSLNLYRVATTEINNRLQRQITFISTDESVTSFGISTTGPIEKERIKELEASKNNIAIQLAQANLLIFIMGGIGSYLLARRTLQPIEEAHMAQSRFAADASHELRTPLAALRTETEVTLRNPKLTVKEARQQLRSNLEELERLSELSNGLLQLARGTNDTAKEPNVNLRDLVVDAIKQRDAQASAKNITISMSKIPKTTITANRTQLTQTVVILLDNAIKYGTAGGSITIDVEHRHQSVALNVHDNGAGMSEADLSHIFDRFYRADAARSSANTPGYGLGLAIAQQIVTSHGGNISAVSTLGEGSTFTIVLPRS